jgi:hypothetical protein
MEESHDQTAPVLTEPATQNVAAYIDTLKRIHVRLVIEGYRIVDGEVVPPGQDGETESQSRI